MADDNSNRNSATNNNERIDVGIEATSLPLFDSKTQLKTSSEEMFNNLNGYITSEIELTLEDYKLLEAMNNCTVEKFQTMTQIAENVAKNMDDLNEKYMEMLPKLDIIDKLDKKITRLEKMAYAIDAYSKRLEKQYKLLEKGLNEPPPPHHHRSGSPSPSSVE